MKKSGSELLLAALFLLIPACISAQQSDLTDYFPHSVSDLWQYEELNTTHRNVHGFLSRKIFEIRVTRVDTLEDGSRYVYVNNNHTPRWYIDSLYVYQMPSKLRLFAFDTDALQSWWVTPEPDTTDLGRNYWRHTGSPADSDVLDRPAQVRTVSEYLSRTRGDTTNWASKTELYATGLGLVNSHGGGNPVQWELRGAVIGGDTLGVIHEMEAPDIFTWFPMRVGNRWQYGHSYNHGISEFRVTGIDTLTDGSMDIYINDQLRYMINSERSIAYYKTIQDAPRILFMLNAGMSEPWWQYEDYDELWGGETWIQMTHSYMAGIFGNTVQAGMRVYTYFYSAYAGMDYTAIHTWDIGYAEGIGEIYEADYEHVYRFLIGAEIDGQIFGTLVSIDEDETDVPAAFTLHQNYPNPFNPSTVIRYELPEGGHVRLAVYDMMGRRVAELVNGPVQAGSHTADFDGSRLASGVYVYRLQSGGQVLSGKMMLVK